MKQNIDIALVHEAGLTKKTIEVYLPLESAQSESFGTAEIPEKSEKRGRSDAERQRKHKAKLAENGLGQLNVVLPTSADIRTHMSALANRLVTLGSWEAAIAAEPMFQEVKAYVANASIRLLRLEDLEKRHRRTRVFIDFHYELATATGIRKFLLRLAGAYRPCLLNQNNSTDEESNA